MKFFKNLISTFLCFSIIFMSITPASALAAPINQAEKQTFEVKFSDDTIVKCVVDQYQVEAYTYVNGELKDQSIVDLITKEVKLKKNPSDSKFEKHNISEYINVSSINSKNYDKSSANIKELPIENALSYATSPSPQFPSYLYDTDITISYAFYHPYLWANYGTTYGNSYLIKYNSGDYVSLIVSTIVGALIGFFTAGGSALVRFSSALITSLGGSVASGVITKAILGTANCYKNYRRVAVALNGALTGIEYYKAEVYATGLNSSGQVVLTDYLGIEGDDTRSAYQMCYDACYMLFQNGQYQ